MPEIPRSASFDAEACIAQLKLSDERGGAGDVEGAVRHARAALAINPENSLIHDDVVYLLSFHPDTTDEQIAGELREWEHRHARPFLDDIAPHANDPDPNRRLKIGYVSPEFWRQAESHFVVPLLEAHNHDQFEIHCYSSVEKPDERTAQIRKLADVWHEVRQLSDEQLAERIRGDGIDILVDLSMHMRNSRMLTFARRPAPIQIAWLAYPGSTGLATIDYRLTDRYFDPPDQATPFVETPWRLPDCWVCYHPLQQSALAPPRSNRPMTFGSLNHPRKMNDVNLRLWARTMKQIEGSRMILHVIAEDHRRRAAAIFEQEGISPDRLEFMGFKQRWEYLRMYDRIDVALDTLPYSGITTTCDALWMGTPVVTLVGRTIASRGGLGILSTIGLPELIARNAEQFVKIATDLARDRDRLADFRKTLRGRIESSPLMDKRRFAANVETAYREMWRKHQSQSSPREAEMANERAMSLLRERKFPEAIAAAREAISSKPDFADAHNTLANALRAVGDFRGGIDAYREAIRIDSNLPYVHLNLGNTLKETGKIDDGIAAFRKAIGLNPALPEAHSELGNALLALGRVEEAATEYREAIRLRPNFAEAHGNLLLALNYLPDVDPATVFAEHRAWAKLHALARGNRDFGNDRNPNRRLRIGYVSADFRRHSVAYFLMPIFERRNHDHFEIVCYSGVQRPDEFADRFKRLCDAWRDVAPTSDDALAEIIRNDAIDILVDLSGHTAGNRLKVFARKPAPIQVTYLGSANTTGISAIDYRFTDALADPPGMTDSLNAEKLWRLPICAWCYEPLENSPDVQPRSPGPIVFGSFNSFAKINAGVIAAWSEILETVAGSKLLLKSAGAGEESSRQRLLAEFAKRGVSAERIEMLPRVGDFAEHLRLYSGVDIALDTFPYDGTTTTCEALWMGVPVITLAGKTHASRVGVSLLSQVGLDDLIAGTPAEYVSIASKLADDPDRLASLRAELRSRVKSSPLLDAGRFAADIESAFRAMWGAWCASEPIPTKMPGDMNLDKELQAGIAFHQAGKLADAEKIYRRILAAQPRNADALYLLGTLAGQCGNAEAAIQLIRQAIDARPESPDAYRNLGTLLAGQGRVDEAVAAYQKVFQFRPNDADAHNDLGKVLAHHKRFEEAIPEFSTAIQINPRHADAHKKLGDVLRGLKRNDEAFAAYSKALALDPNSPDAHLGAGESLRQIGKLDEAETEIRRAIQLQPNYPEAYVYLGNVYCMKARVDEGIRAFVTAMQLKPDYPLAYYNLGQALRSADRLEKAIEAYKSALNVDPNHLDALTSVAISLSMLQRFDEAISFQQRAAQIAPNAGPTHEAMGEILLRMQKGDEAIAAFRQAVACDPKLVTAWNALGSALRSQGKFDDAAGAFRRALELDPQSAMAYQNLASVKKIAASKGEIDRLTGILARHDLDLSGEIAARFALGKLLDEGDSFDEAFAQFAAANALVKKQRAMAGEKYNPEGFQRHVDQMIDTFTPEFFREHAGWGDPSELPVFIVGMPRSGTTLLHQIAASHPAVHGAGELMDIGKLAKNFEGPGVLKTIAAQWTREKVDRLAREQIERFHQMNPAASRIVDKMPNNVVYLGLISLLFPNSRIVLCRRDPRDTCLSCFFQWFATGLTFAFDLTDCGHYQRQTYRLMDHWLKVLPIRHIEVHYEKVVADQESESRRLIDFLGLPWDPACLEFQRSKAEVLTASAWQVRQPIYNNSVERWRRYEKHLRPLFAALAK